MQKAIIILFLFSVALFFSNCSRSKMKCFCTGTVYIEDYGTQPDRQRDRYEKECEKHEVDNNTHCSIVQ